MNSTFKSYRNLIIAAVAVAGSVAYANLPQAETAWGDDVAAWVSVPNPRMGSLLWLRGYTGSGEVQFKIGGSCSSMKVRFVAGDFGGQGISINPGAPIRFKINNKEMVRDLRRGKDLVSEDVVIGNWPGADVVAISGITPSTGFVINVGDSVWADLFGPHLRKIPCSSIRTKTAGR